MEPSKLIIEADNGHSTSIDSTVLLGRSFVHREFGLLDCTISREHCQIRWRGRHFWVRDGAADGLCSLIGTFLDGRRLPCGHWEPIPQSARLRIGATVLSLRHESPYSSEFDIMISYSRKDEAAVLEIYKAMRDMGLEPWMDQMGGNAPAAHYMQGIERAMAETKAVAVFWGGDRMGDIQAAEVEVVTRLHIKHRIRHLFLVILPGSENPEWGEFLNSIDFYDLRKDGEYERFTRALSAVLLPADQDAKKG